MEVFGHNIIQEKGIYLFQDRHYFFLIIVSAGIPALLEDAMEKVVTVVLERCLEEITHTGIKSDIRYIKDNARNMQDDIRDVKQDIRNLAADVGLVARTAALVSFHPNYTR